MIKHFTYKTIFNNNSEGGDKWQKNTYKILNGTLSFQNKFEGLLWNVFYRLFFCKIFY